MKMPFMRHVTWYLVIVMFIIGIAPKVDASLVQSEMISLMRVYKKADLEKIQKFLEMKAVSKRLEQLGLTKEEIQKRLNQLSDQQIHQIALQLDDLRIGKDDALGVIIALLLITLLIALLLQLTGHKVVVTK